MTIENWLCRNGRLVYSLACHGFFIGIFTWLAATASLKAAAVATLPFVVFWSFALHLAPESGDSRCHDAPRVCRQEARLPA